MGPGVRRDDKEFSFINIKFSNPHGDSYPPLPNRSYDRRVLSKEGALLEAILKWDRARADWCGATRTGRCGAWGRASQARSREALGIRPALKGVCHRSWLDGDRRAARNRRGLPSPLKRGPGFQDAA